MPDIAMCEDKKCGRKDKCYRYTAKPSEFRQSYFAESTRIDEQCEYFLVNATGDARSDRRKHEEQRRD